MQDESPATSDDSSADDDGGASSGGITRAIKDMSDRLSDVLSDVTAKLAALDHRVAAAELEVKQGFVRVGKGEQLEHSMLMIASHSFSENVRMVQCVVFGLLGGLSQSNTNRGEYISTLHCVNK